MGKRTKQINITIPAASVPVLEEFDQMCAAHDIGRSEMLVTLMQDWLSKLEGTEADDPRQQQDALWPSERYMQAVRKQVIENASAQFRDAMDDLEDSNLPEFLK